MQYSLVLIVFMYIMRILGIESSCDETAIAVVSGSKDNLKVEKSVVLSQVKIHAKYGGVVPEVAARKHLEAIFPMLKNEINQGGEDIDAIAVTAGPGLASALRTGVEVAKTLAWLWKKPLVPVSHLEGHIYASWLKADDISISNFQFPIFPALCLIVSGGHTELVLMKSHGEYERIGETLDDAAGEAFDKTAKMLGLQYPGGPEIAKYAKGGRVDAFDFPRGLLNRPNCDFSFSGLKTSVLYKLRENEDQLNDIQFKRDVSASIQEAIVDVLVRKTVRAVKKVNPASIILAGGVAANEVLRERLKEASEKLEIPLHVPEFKYSMDNAAMIAAAGYFRAQSESNFINPLKLKADPNLDLI